MALHEVFETSLGRWGFNLTDGSACGAGYRNREEADTAATQALGRKPCAIAPMKADDRKAYAGLEWLGL